MHLAGSTAIHDFEIAMFGETSEDVAEGLVEGTGAVTAVVFGVGTMAGSLGPTVSSSTSSHRWSTFFLSTSSVAASASSTLLRASSIAGP
jgi:hypothetical protein